MSITVASIGLAVARAQGAMPALEQELNAAYAKLGDGDTGGMLARLVGRMAEQDLSAVPDLGTAFSILARAAAAATGSSLGTLFATALLTLGRETKGRQSVPERSEEHTSEIQSLMRISYAVFCLKKKKKTYNIDTEETKN